MFRVKKASGYHKLRGISFEKKNFDEKMKNVEESVKKR